MHVSVGWDLTHNTDLTLLVKVSRFILRDFSESRAELWRVHLKTSPAVSTVDVTA